MPTRTKSRESDQERRVWALLTRDFEWEPPSGCPVQIYGVPNSQGALLQLFEVAMTLVLAHLRPDYTWEVTQKARDGGMDFLGQQPFLHDASLDITAAIKVGGQCKKRTTPDKITREVAGDLVDMARHENPTFFVVAFSARLTKSSVKRAQENLQHELRRHCHILDRAQIEGLIGDHFEVVEETIRAGLGPAEAQVVVDYFSDGNRRRRASTVKVDRPHVVRAGLPFRVNVDFRSTLVSAPGMRLWWLPTKSEDSTIPVSPPLGPIGIDSPVGIQLMSYAATDDPLLSRPSIELISYAVGGVALGELVVGAAPDDLAERIPLGQVEVVENIRPSFFDGPYLAGIDRLQHAYDLARADGAGWTAVVGPAGSGKSRMCEEFALQKGREGTEVVSAKQTKTHDDPHRILADLLYSLADDCVAQTSRAESVITAVARYDRSLADNAAPAIRSLFGVDRQSDGEAAEHHAVSALLLLLVARGRRAPVIVHLQDLHWCTTDLLLVLERVMLQVGKLFSEGASARAHKGVLFVLEGRVGQRDESEGTPWTSKPFETFVQRLGAGLIVCSSFQPVDGLAFVRHLFERAHHANRLVSDRLLPLQEDLIHQIDRTAGGNPFHTLEQVQLLKRHRVLGQNPRNGLLYMIKPDPTGYTLPPAVFESICLRWQYIRDEAPDLALLLWGCALLEDRLPRRLFQALRRELAPNISVRDVDATDILWTGDGANDEVAFRHENYFESLRRFDVRASDRERVVHAYSAWFAGFRSLSAIDRFRWARALLELPEPNPSRVRARRLLGDALRTARHDGDVRMLRRIAGVSLELAWEEDDRQRLPAAVFFRRHDEEMELTRSLLAAERGEAGSRLDRLRRRMQARLAGPVRSPVVLDELRRRHLLTEVVYVEYLFNAKRPADASTVAAAAVREIDSVRPRGEGHPQWDELEMEALHAYSVALALSGEMDRAYEMSERSIAFARRSSSYVAKEVLATHGNILLFGDPEAGERFLRECLAADDRFHPAEINLGIALLLLAHRRKQEESGYAVTMLLEARERLGRVFNDSYRLGLYPDAAAAALLQGIICAVCEDGKEALWFGQAVAAATRGQQMETLWRSQVNLAIALFERDQRVTPMARDQAAGALEIMEATLAPYAEPDTSPRFRLLQVSMAHAVRLLVVAGDAAGPAALERYPALRSCFTDPLAGELREDRGGVGHGWIVRVGAADYMIY